MSQTMSQESEASLGDEAERLELAREISMLPPQGEDTDEVQQALLDSQREAVLRRVKAHTPLQGHRGVKAENTPVKSARSPSSNDDGPGEKKRPRAQLDLTQPGAPGYAIDLDAPVAVGGGVGVDGGGGVGGRVGGGVGGGGGVDGGRGRGVGGGGGAGGRGGGGGGVGNKGIDWPTLLAGLDIEQVKAVRAVAEGHNVVLIGAGGCGKSLTLARIVSLLLEQKKKGAAGTPTHGARKVMEANLAAGLAAGQADKVVTMTLAKMFGCMPGEAIRAQPIATKVSRPQ